MKKNELISIESLRMTSLEIAELTNKEHFHVLRDIEKMCSDLEIDVQLFGDIYLDKYKRKQKLYELPKRETLILVSGYSIQLRAKIIDKWQFLEKELQTRQALKLEYPSYQDAIKYAIENSDSANYKKFGFTQENNLIYVIALGMNAKKFREIHGLQEKQSIRPYITTEQAEAVLELQAMNATFLKIGMEYDDRKLQLKKYFDAKYKAKQMH